MAGLIGTVRNTPTFQNYVIKYWYPWMEEAVILHFSGVGINELTFRFNKSKTHLENLMRSNQAKEIVERIAAKSIEVNTLGLSDKLAAAKNQALSNVVAALADDNLKRANPFDFWDNSRKSLETLNRMSTPLVSQVINNNSVTQNNLNISQEALAKLRAAPTMNPSLEAVHHVDYIGPPPPTGRNEEGVHGRGVSISTSEGEDGPSIPLSGRPTP